MGERSAAIKRKCLKGACCVRCGRSYSLECHHIISLQFGGIDAEDNTVALCHDCHKDWHNVYDPLKADNGKEWQEFLEADHPAIGIALAKAISSGELDDCNVTPKDALDMTRKAWKKFVSLRNSGFSPSFIEDMASKPR